MNQIEGTIGYKIEFTPEENNRSVKNVTNKTKYEHGKNRKNIYIQDEVWIAFKAACDLTGKSMSEVITKFAKRYIAKHAPVLRKSRVQIPDSVFQP